jgi:tRNA(Ile)-lysidine synthetase-like protein
VLALELSRLRSLPLATQRQVFHSLAQRMGVALEFKHIQQLTSLMEQRKLGRRLVLPGDLVVNRTARELQFTRFVPDLPRDYCYSLPIPGEIVVPELGVSIRAQLITAGKQKASGYNAATLLDRSLLGSTLIVRNWRAGDRFFPAHSHSPKKVKELLQPARLGHELSSVQRKNWPVIESAGQIVWMRGFPVSQLFAGGSGDAVLIEEKKMSAEAGE